MEVWHPHYSTVTLYSGWLYSKEPANSQTPILRPNSLVNPYLYCGSILQSVCIYFIQLPVHCSGCSSLDKADRMAEVLFTGTMAVAKYRQNIDGGGELVGGRH